MNILLLTPKLNGYYLDIKKNLESKNHYVKWHCSNPVGNNFDKILDSINPNFFMYKFDEYINNIITENSSVDFDKVLVIFGGIYFRKKHVDLLKENFPDAEFIYYNWDSIANYPEIKNFYKEFDRYYSFDIEDCKNFGFTFLPLFYCNAKDINVDPIYDLFAIMSYGPNKERGYKSIKKVLPHELRINEYLYTPNQLKIFMDRFLKKSYLSNIDLNNLHFKPMPRGDVYTMIQKSRVVLDTPRDKQNGLTMRTFETLSQNRKLITTNSNIKKYDFYCDENIWVVDNDLEEIPISFFEKPFNKKYSISEEYSLNSFINKIFGWEDII